MLQIKDKFQPTKNKPKKPNLKPKSKNNLEKSITIPKDPEKPDDGSLSEELVVREVMEFILNKVSETHNVSTDKVSTPLQDIEKHYISDNDINSISLSDSETSVDSFFY